MGSAWRSLGVLTVALAVSCSSTSPRPAAKRPVLSTVPAPSTKPAAAKPNQPKPLLDVLHYDVHLVLDGSRITRAAASITWDPETTLGSLTLRADALSIEGITLSGTELEYSHTANKLLVRLPNELPPRPTVRIEYVPRADATSGTADIRFAAYHSARWLPCHFHPGDRATLQLKLDLPSEWSAIAPSDVPNGKLGEFSLETATPPHMYGFAAGKFVSLRSPGKPGLVTAGRFDRTAHTRLTKESRKMVAFFAQASGIPYPGSSYAHVFLPGKVAQELAGMAFISERYLKTWPATPTEDWLIAHELAHQWWGGLVGAANWGEFWLNEAFAVFMTAAWKEHRHGRDAYDRERDLARKRYDATIQAGKDRPLSLPDDASEADVTDKLAYTKGALALFDARDRLGDKAFWTAIREYTQAARGTGVARTSDLIAALESAHGKSLTAWRERWLK